VSRWPLVPLGEVIQLTPDPYPVSVEASYPNLGIYSFGRGVFRKPPIDGNATSAGTLYRVRAGQFIYSRLFAFEGAYGIVPESLDGSFVSAEFPAFTCSEARLLFEYLKWLFKRGAVWQEVATGSKGMGDRRQRVHPERVLEYRIPLPPLDEQRRIVARLDGVAERIERRRRATEAIDTRLAAILRAAFDRITRNAPHARMADVAPLVRRQVKVEPNAIYQEVGVRSFGRGLFEKPDLHGNQLTWQKLFRIREGDLVFSNIKAWEGAFAVAEGRHCGKVGSHRYLTCVCNPDRVMPYFLWYFLQSPAGLEQIQAVSPGSADRNRTLSQKGLEEICLPLPSLAAQRWFTQLQARVASIREAQLAADEELSRLLPAILDRIFH
jgi:type I restriction enzyme S subunit